MSSQTSRDIKWNSDNECTCDTCPVYDTSFSLFFFALKDDFSSKHLGLKVKNVPLYVSSCFLYMTLRFHRVTLYDPQIAAFVGT